MVINETDSEVDSAGFEIIGTKYREGDAQSKNDDSISEIGNGEGIGQSYSSLAALSAHHLKFESANRVKPRSVARVGGDGEWGIHGIIDKEVIEGKVYYCVDWEPTMVRVDELLGAESLVREFETKEEVQLRRASNTRERKHHGRLRKQK
jgi:hypothetical protein